MVASFKPKPCVALFKKFLFFFALFTVVSFPASSFTLFSGPAQEGQVKFWIGQTYYESQGQRHSMDVSPFLSQGRAYVPVRFLAYALGIEEEDIRWDGATQTVTLSKEELTLRIQLNSFLLERRIGLGPWISLLMDVVPQMRSNRVFLPVRYVAMGLGYSVAWEQNVQQVTLVPGPSLWVEELALQPNPQLPEKGLSIQARTRYPTSQIEVRLKGVSCSSEPNEFWRKTDTVILNPGGPGEWVVGLVGPGRLGIYPVEAKIEGFTFTCEEWLLKVYPPDFLQQPGYGTAEEAVRERFLQDFPGCTLKKMEPRSLLPDDGRDPRFHALFLLSFYQPYDRPALPQGENSVFYYALKDGPLGLWRALGWGTGP